MKTSKKFIIITSCFLFLTCLGINLSQAEDEDSWEDEYRIISEDETWKKGDNLFFDKPIIITNGKTLTIEKGAEIIFNKSSGIEVRDGKIIADGTADEKIIFKNNEGGYDYNIYFNTNDHQSFFRYVNIVNAGSVPANQVRGIINNLLIKTANAQFFPNEFGMPSISIMGGKLHMENCEFINSQFQDIEVELGYYYNAEDESSGPQLSELEIVNTNFSSDRAVESYQCNDYFDAMEMPQDSNRAFCDRKVYLKNNYYGDADGPNIDVNDEEEDVNKGFYLKGDFELDDFKKNKMIIDPVIVIPGILGSADDIHGNLKIDPIWHKYDNLILSLKDKQFVENKYLFTFPYDWRNKNTDSAQLLKNKISDVVGETKISKVDLVGHSMGGLVARAYVEYYFDNNVDQLITLGTPHKGSPEAYLKWEAGEELPTSGGFILKRHLNHEAKEHNYDDLGLYIRDRVLSVGELLPDYSYLWDAEGDKLRTYPDLYPRNYFLENLNDPYYLDNLKKVKIINITGKTIINNTIDKIKVITSEYENMWLDGMPETFYDDLRNSLIMGEGDTTVPLFSAKAIVADKEIELDMSHTDLPTGAQCYIYEELSNNFIDENVEEEDQICKEIDKYGALDINWLLFNVFSPVDIQIVDPNNKRIGKDFITGENIIDEIEDAYYSGHTDKNGQKIKAEFIVITNPIPGEYKILTQGTDNGKYRIEVAKIGEKTDDTGKAEVYESEVKIEGDVEIGKEGELEIMVAEETVTNESIEEDIAPPIIEITSPQNKTYLKNEQLNIDFEVSDNKTSKDNIQIEKIFDNEIVTQNIIDLSLLKTGEHKLMIKAVDEMGNKSEKEIVFNISTNIEVLKNNINHYYGLKLIKTSQERKMLSNNLSVIEGEIELYNIIKNNIFIKSKAKKILLNALENQIQNHIEIVIKKIEQDKKNYVTIIKSVIIDDLGFIKNNIK